jgi:hypothetical protein
MLTLNYLIIVYHNYAALEHRDNRISQAAQTLNMLKVLHRSTNGFEREVTSHIDPGPADRKTSTNL